MKIVVKNVLATLLALASLAYVCVIILAGPEDWTMEIVPYTVALVGVFIMAMIALVRGDIGGIGAALCGIFVGMSLAYAFWVFNPGNADWWQDIVVGLVIGLIGAAIFALSDRRQASARSMQPQRKNRRGRSL